MKNIYVIILAIVILCLPKSTMAQTTGNTVYVTSITIMPNVISALPEGEFSQLFTWVAPDDATDKSLTWSSDNPEVVTVNQTGFLTAVKAGTTYVRATANDGSGVSGEAMVTVVGPTKDYPEYLYTPNGANFWNPASSQKLYRVDDSPVYCGFIVTDSFGFELITAPDWDGAVYGKGNVEGTLIEGRGTINVECDGLYWCEVDLDNMTYEVTYIRTIGIIGEFSYWGEDVPMIPENPENPLIWNGEVELKGYEEFKFRCNNDWDINLGGCQSGILASSDDVIALCLNGSNMTLPEGIWMVTIDLGQLPYIFWVSEINGIKTTDSDCEITDEPVFISFKGEKISNPTCGPVIKITGTRVEKVIL